MERKMSTALKVSIILNSIIASLVAIGTLCMLSGFKFSNESGIELAFTASNLNAFKYFTVDSNVLAGIASLIFLIFEVKLAKGQISELPKFLYSLKLAATSAITLTMMVTVFFLTPQFKEDWFTLFKGINLFYHLIIPLLCLISFVFFEKPSLYTPAQTNSASFGFGYSFTGLIPMALYAFFYTINVMTHLQDGLPTKDYDWYNFLLGKVSNAFISIPAMIVVTWLISLGLWALNRHMPNKI